MSELELRLQKMGILAEMRAACEKTRLSLYQLVCNIQAIPVDNRSVVPDIMSLDTQEANKLLSSILDDFSGTLSVLPSSAEEACKMMVDAFRDLGIDTLSGEEAFELCL